MSKHDPFGSRSEREARDYEVGYGKPPKSTRFQPGQSGNRSGRSKARANYAALTRLELDKTITLGRGDNSRTVTQRQVIAARLRKAVRGGDIEAFKLAMQLDQDPASDEPINPAKERRLFWAKEEKDLIRDLERWEVEKRRPEESSSSEGSDVEGASSDDATTLDPDEIPMRSTTMSKPDTDDGRAQCEKQDFEVGYGKPPKATRFQPGRSGHKGHRRKRSTTLEFVREHHAGLHSFRSMRRMEASRRKARALWLRHSQSLASRRQRPSQAKVRSTIQRLGSATKPGV